MLHAGARNGEVSWFGSLCNITDGVNKPAGFC